MKDPNTSRPWWVYLGLVLLAVGVAVLVTAAFLSYAAAIR